MGFHQGELMIESAWCGHSIALHRLHIKCYHHENEKRKKEERKKQLEKTTSIKIVRVKTTMHLILIHIKLTQDKSVSISMMR